MKRIWFNVLKWVALIAKIFSHELYMRVIVKAYKVNGATITGMPAFIDHSAHVDTSGGLTISKGVGISVNAIVLTHDWSFLRRYRARNITPPPTAILDPQAFKPVFIDEYSLVGAGAIVLPGTHIGKYCLIGAGAVVKGVIEDYAIVVGNPARKIGDTRDEKFKLVTCSEAAVKVTE